MLIFADPWVKMQLLYHVVLIYAPELKRWMFGGIDKDQKDPVINLEDKAYFNVEELWILNVQSEVKTSKERNDYTEAFIGLEFPDHFVNRMTFEDETTKWWTIYKLNKSKSLGMINNV